jgi:hypothetical protein
MVRSIIIGLLVAATAQAAPAQDHHCQLPDGSFDGGKTHKQCTDAKGKWQKDAEYRGKLETGVVAVGGESTGMTITVGAATYEVDVHGDKTLGDTAQQLNGKEALVTGYLETRQGVETGKRQIIVATTLRPAPAVRK